MAKSSAGGSPGATPPRVRRGDANRIAKMIDLASAAKQIADETGEAFVAHLLAMAILEMRTIHDTTATTRPTDVPRARPGRRTTSA